MIFLYSKTGSPKKSQSGSIPNPNHLKEVEEYVNNSLEEKLKDFVKRVSHFDIQKDVVCWESKLDVLPNEKKDKKREYDRQNYLKKKKLNGTKLQKERNEKKDKKREYDKHNYLKKKKLKDTK